MNPTFFQKLWHIVGKAISAAIVSPVSKKDSFRIIMALVAHYDLELNKMDVKIAFLNGNLNEEVYMDQSLVL